MDGIAPDDASERDRRIVGFAAALRGIERNRDRRRNFQRAGHGDDVVTDTGSLQLGDGTFQQRILDVVIEARLDDQRAGARYVGLIFQLCAPRVRHLTPRSQCCAGVLVAAPQEAKHYTAHHWPGSARYDDFVVKQVTSQRGFGSRSFG